MIGPVEFEARTTMAAQLVVDRGGAARGAQQVFDRQNGHSANGHQGDQPAEWLVADSQTPERPELNGVKVRFMNEAEDLDELVLQLETVGYAVVDFGSTFGIVFRPDERRDIARRRLEPGADDPNTVLERASLVAPPSLVNEYFVHQNAGLRPEIIQEIIEAMTQIGFIRCVPNVEALLDNKNPAYVAAMQEHFVNTLGEVQFYPLIGHIFEAWARKHPDQPVLAVRSANRHGDAEQWTRRGATQLARDLDLGCIDVISREHYGAMVSDEEIIVRMGEQYPSRFAQYNLKGYLEGVPYNHAAIDPGDEIDNPPKLERSRPASVPIIEIGSFTPLELVGADRIEHLTYVSAKGVLFRPGDSPENIPTKVNIYFARFGNVSPEAMELVMRDIIANHADEELVFAYNSGDTKKHRHETEFPPGVKPGKEAQQVLAELAMLNRASLMHPAG